MAKFNLEHPSLKILLVADTRYTIPDYQRPYSWDCAGKSELNNQINRMWDDLIEFFKDTKTDPTGEYFFGSMVMISKKGATDTYEVVDGQQRLTSLILLYVAIKCFLTKVDSKEIKCIGSPEDIHLLEDAVKDAIRTVNDLLYNKEALGLRTEKKVKIEKSAEFNYDEVLEKVMECKEKLVWTDVTPEQQINIDKYYRNRDFFVNCIEQTFSEKGELDTENYIKIDQFMSFLQNRVRVVKITTDGDFTAAYQIFEILNNRGLPLSSKDLFRNFVIKEFAAIKDKDPSEKWIKLEQKYALTPDFLSRWVESVKGGQQKFSAFNDLNEIYGDKKRYNDIGKPKIEKLYTDIQQSLLYYTYISRDTNLIVDKVLRNKILFLKNAGNQGYTYNLLIALFRYLKFENTTENEKLIAFLTQYEIFVLYGILAPNRRFSSSSIYQAINALNDNNYDKAHNEFILAADELSELKDLLNQDIKDNKTAALLIAKCHWVAETQKSDVDEFILDFKAATLEHIIPQTSDKDTNWLRDFTPEFRKNYTYKIGNMTLLTQSMNSSVKNYDFEVKKEGVKKKSKGYKDTNFPFTAELCKHTTIQPKDIEDRQTRFLELLCTDLNL